MRFDFDAARAAGYSDDEIAEYLGSEVGFDSRAALKSGYSSRDILDYLRSDGGVLFDSAEKNAQIGAGQASVRAIDNAAIRDEESKRIMALPQPEEGQSVMAAMDGMRPGTPTSASSRLARQVDAVGPNEVSSRFDPEGGIEPIVGAKPTIGNLASDLGNTLADSASGMKQGIRAGYADLVGVPGMLDDALRKTGQAQLDSAINTPAIEDPTLAGIYGGVKSIVQTAPGMALSAVNPALGLAVLGAQSGLPKYAEYREQGVTPGKAAPAAAAYGMVEAGTELFPMLAIVKKFGRVGAAKFIGEVLAKDMPGEWAATIGQNAIDATMSKDPQATQKYFASLPADLYQTTIATLTQAGLMAGASKAVQKSGLLDPLDPQYDHRSEIEKRFGESPMSSQQPAITNFTPPDSPSAQAGLEPIVVPTHAVDGSTVKGEDGALMKRQTVVGQTSGDELLKRIPVLDENGAPVPNEAAPPVAPTGEVALQLGGAAAQTESAPTSSPPPEPRTNWRSTPISNRTDAELEHAIQNNVSETSRRLNQEELDRRRAAQPQSFAAAQQPGLGQTVVQPTGTEARSQFANRENAGITPAAVERTPSTPPTTVPDAVAPTATAPTQTATAAPPVNVTKVKERLTQIFGEKVAGQVSLLRGGVVPTGATTPLGPRTEGYFLAEDGANVMLDAIGVRNNTKLDNDELATWVGTHEILHSGAWQQAADKGLKYDADGYNSVLRAAEKNPVVSKIAAKKNGSKKNRASAGVNAEEALVEIGAALETGNLAELGTRYGVTFTPAATTKVGKLYQDLIAKARSVLRRVGIVKEMSDNDVRALLTEWKAGAQKFAANRERGVPQTTMDRGVMLSEAERQTGTRTNNIATEAIQGEDLTRSQMNRAVRWLKRQPQGRLSGKGQGLRSLHDQRGRWTVGTREIVAARLRDGTIPRSVIDDRPGVAGHVATAIENVGENLRNRLNELRRSNTVQDKMLREMNPVPSGKTARYYEERANRIYDLAATLPNFPRGATFRERMDWWHQNHPTSLRRWRQLNDAYYVAAESEQQQARSGAPASGSSSNPTLEEVMAKGWHGEYAISAVRFTPHGQPNQTSDSGVHNWAVYQQLHRVGYDLNKTVTPQQATRMLDGWKQIARQPKSFKYGIVKPESKTVEAIARDLGLYDMGYDPEFRPLTSAFGQSYVQMTFRNPATGVSAAASMEYSGDLGHGRGLVAHTASLNSDGLGSAVYQLMADFSVKNSLWLYPDGVLLPINTFRRSEQMLSNAIRNNKTMMLPHRTQRIWGFEEGAQTQDAHDRNTVRLLIANLRAAEELFPGIKDIDYDLRTGKFTFRDPARGDSAAAERFVKEWIGDPRDNSITPNYMARFYGLGRTTVARAALTRNMIEGVAIPNVEPTAAILYSEADENNGIETDEDKFLAEVNAELAMEAARRRKDKMGVDPNSDFNYATPEDLAQYAAESDMTPRIGEESTQNLGDVEASERGSFVLGTFDPTSDLYDSIPKTVADAIAQTWRKIADRAGAMTFKKGRAAKYDPVDAKAMQKLAEQMGMNDLLRRDENSAAVKLIVKEIPYAEVQEHATKGFRLIFVDHNGQRVKGVDISYHPDDGGTYLEHNGYRVERPHYVVHSAGLAKGSKLGTYAYQLIGAYAARSGVVIAPDHGLTAINERRRTEQHISIALRTGNPTIMLPGKSQKVFGFDENAVSDEDQERNFVRLVVASTRNWQRMEPRIFRLRYDVQNDHFTTLDGDDAETDVAKIVERRYKEGLGRTTVARAVINQMLLDKAPVKTTAPAKILYSEAEELPENPAIRNWITNFTLNPAKADQQIALKNTLHSAYASAGISTQQPVVLDRDDFVHSGRERMGQRGLAPNTPSNLIAGIEPLLAQEPRMVVTDTRGEEVVAYLPKRVGGHPVKLVLERGTAPTRNGPTKVVGIKTMFGAVDSAFTVIEQLMTKGAKITFMPDADLAKLREMIASVESTVKVKGPKRVISATTPSGKTTVEFNPAIAGKLKALKIVFSEVDEDIWYSPLKLEVGLLPMKSGDAKAWLGALQGLMNKGGVKQDEVSDAAFKDWLEAQGGRVSKEQVLDYLDSAVPKLGEDVRGGGRPVKFKSYADALSYLAELNGITPSEVVTEYGYTDRDDFIHLANRQWRDNLNGRTHIALQRLTDDVFQGSRVSMAEWQDAVEEMSLDQIERKYKLDQLPQEDAESLREYVREYDKMVRPEDAEYREYTINRGTKAKEYVEIAVTLKGEQKYGGGHFGPNTVAHVRLTERMTKDGQPIVVMEEFQSDWGGTRRDIQWAKKNNVKPIAAERVEDLGPAPAPLTELPPDLRVVSRSGGVSTVAFYDELRRVVEILDEKDLSEDDEARASILFEVDAEREESYEGGNPEDAVITKVVKAARKLVPGSFQSGEYSQPRIWAIADQNGPLANKWSGSKEEAIAEGIAYLNEQRRYARSMEEQSVVPPAPFVEKTEPWMQLLVRRALKYAADKKIDRLAWATGTHQFYRYGTNRIDWKRQADGSFKVGVEAYVDPVNDFTPRINKPVASEADLVKLLRRTDEVPERLAKRAWAAMQQSDEGTLRPRAEGNDAFYGNEFGQQPNGKPAMVATVIKEALRKFDVVKFETFTLDEKDQISWERDQMENETEEEYNQRMHGEDAGDGAPAFWDDVKVPGFRITEKLKIAGKQKLPMYSDADEEVRHFAIPRETAMQKARRKVQDFMLRARVIEEAITKQGGIVNDNTSVYRAFERMAGRVQSEMIRFRDEFMQPLVKRMADANVTFDELAIYAYAMHAKERNAHIQSINPKFVGTNNGSGMTDDQADMILQIFDHEGLTPKMQQFHRDLMALTESTRRVLLDAGLIDQDTYDNWTNLYANYVPLRGFENLDIQEDGTPKFRTGRAINIRGGESVRALGRRSEAGQIIENIILDYERAVIRSERNDVAKVLADLVTSNPDSKLWEINAERKQRGFDKQRQVVVTTYITDKGDDTVGLKINGQPVYIKIHDKLLARALRQSFLDETGQLQRALHEQLGWYTDFMRNTLTRYNPGFVVTNSIRDFETGAVSVLDKLGAGATAKYANHYRSVWGATLRYERGKLDLGKEWDRWMREYADAGGITGGFFMRDAEAVLDELRAELIDAGGTVHARGKGMGWLADWTYLKVRGNTAGRLAAKTLRVVETMGSMSENASRLAAYRTAREMGKSAAEAARIAKNLTTNFNRKGEWGTALSSLYLFYNAAMQGGTRVLYALKNPKVQAAMAGFVGLSMALALANADWGGDDDDGVAFWDKLDDDLKERNLIIMLPPKDKRAQFIKIPMAYGYNVFGVLGNALADSLRYTQDPKRGKPYAKSAINMVSAIFGSFNPVAGSFDPTDPKKLALAVSPTAADLAINVATETNSFGESAAPRKDDRYPRPDSERFFMGAAGTTEQRIARWMNSVSGGNQAQSGRIDVAPATLTTLARGATGGTGQFVLDTFNTVAQLTDSTAEVNPRNIPFFKSVYGVSDERLTSRQFYANRDEIEENYRQLMMAMKAGIKVDFNDPENKALVMLGKHMDAVGEQLSDIRKWEVSVVEDPKLTDKQKELKRKEIAAVREKVMKGYNSQFAKVWGDVR